jgi:hypothetical protein
MVFITLTTVFVVPTMVLVFSTLVFGVEKMFSILAGKPFGCPPGVKKRFGEHFFYPRIQD